jgi:hypothetical protein
VQVRACPPDDAREPVAVWRRRDRLADELLLAAITVRGTTMIRAIALATAAPCSLRIRCRYISRPAAAPAPVTTLPSWRRHGLAVARRAHGWPELRLCPTAFPARRRRRRAGERAARRRRSDRGRSAHQVGGRFLTRPGGLRRQRTEAYASGTGVDWPLHVPVNVVPGSLVLPLRQRTMLSSMASITMSVGSASTTRRTEPVTGRSAS